MSEVNEPDHFVLPHALGLDAACTAMAEDADREAEALEWAEATIGDSGDDDAWDVSGAARG